MGLGSPGHLQIFRQEQERYILEQLDPVIQRMVHAVLRKKPKNLMDFLIDWWLGTRAKGGRLTMEHMESVFATVRLQRLSAEMRECEENVRPEASQRSWPEAGSKIPEHDQ